MRVVPPWPQLSKRHHNGIQLKKVSYLLDLWLSPSLSSQRGGGATSLPLYPPLALAVGNRLNAV